VESLGLRPGAVESEMIQTAQVDAVGVNLGVEKETD